MAHAAGREPMVHMAVRPRCRVERVVIYESEAFGDGFCDRMENPEVQPGDDADMGEPDDNGDGLDLKTAEEAGVAGNDTKLTKP
ncbi:hypothetical protein R1sor_017964 [Riccia sorocarpa]|uniref:Uncharacterized protein n=1 Tax=Riccia sorocarpa TaxID=122646 RepID=A0ABD3ICE1_9MARC